MIDKRKLELFKELFDQSSSILIICPASSTRDQLFAASSFYATLKSNTQKDVKLLCPEDLSKQEQDVAYLDEVQTEIGHENLCISLDYLEDSVDKVSYHVGTETKKFYLTIKPKKGFSPLSKKNVDFSYTGAETDMIILIGIDSLSSLGKLYAGYENLFNSATLVSVNSYETDFGNFKFDILGASSFSEFVAQILVELQIPLDSKSATNLLSGINEETNGFKSYSATADTFDIVSKLMRAGARRINNTEIKAETEADSNGAKVSGSFSIKELTDEQKREKEVFRLKKLAKKDRKLRKK